MYLIWMPPHGTMVIMMNWTYALTQHILVPNTECKLIIVGENADGQPFCLETRVFLREAGLDFFSVHVYFDSANPLDKLEQISFIEFSFQDQGINYYSFVDLVQLDPEVSSCVLKLVSPQELYSYQNRRHIRKPLPPHTNATCRVIGTRQNSAEDTPAFIGQLLEISRSGTSMITSHRMIESLMLELSFHLPEVEAPLLLTGEVRSSTPFSSDSYRVGIEFHDVPLSSLNLIDTYCEQTSS